MTIRRFVQIDGVLYERGSNPRVQVPEIMPDIAPYRSMIDGSEIRSRSQHREHLRAHGYEELGNDSSLNGGPKPLPDVNPQGRKELIRAQIDALNHAEFKRAIRRDIERVKWNSRER